MSILAECWDSDGHSRIVLSKTLTSSYRVRELLSHVSSHALIKPLSSGDQTSRYKPPRRAHSWKHPGKCMDVKALADTAVWSRYGHPGSRCAISWRGLRVERCVGNGRRDASYTGSSWGDRKWFAPQVSAVLILKTWQSLKSTNRFMSTPMGFRYLYAADYIDREMDAWFHVCLVYHNTLHYQAHYLEQRNGIFTMSFILKSS